MGRDQPSPMLGPGEACVEQSRIPAAPRGQQQPHLAVLAALGLVNRERQGRFGGPDPGRVQQPWSWKQPWS